MVMVAHQTEVVKCHTMGSCSGAEKLFESFKIRLIEENFATLNDAVEDVVETGDFKPGFAGHEVLFFGNIQVLAV